MFDFIENIFDSGRIPFLEDGCLELSCSRFLKERDSWMELLYRILEEADNLNVPLFERIRFLAITATVLDEFISDKSHNVPLMRSKIQSFISDQERIWFKILLELGREKIFLIAEHELTEADYTLLKSYIKPFPLDKFPCVPDETLTLAVDFGDEKQLIPLPAHLNRLIRLSDGPQGEIRFVLLEEILDSLVGALFPSKEIREYTLLYVIREYKKIHSNAKGSIKKAIRNRFCAPIALVRMFSYTSSAFTRWIMKRLKTPKTKLIKVSNTLKMDDFRKLILPDRSDLLYPPFQGKKTYKDFFQLLKEQDIVLHHPYDSFDVLIDFLKEAAADPFVKEIRVSLFRTDPFFIGILKKAAIQGKQVFVLIELRALGDEKQNLDFVSELESAGVKVCLGLEDAVTHAKSLTISRLEGEKLVYYNHVSTGNYNANTAKIYSDVGLISTNEKIHKIAYNIFPSPPPSNIKDILLENIQKEIELAQNGKAATIWLKTIALTDLEVIDALYDASRAGVHIEIIARAICLLRPGIPGLSENIRVKSIIGRFLEHSRIVCFGRGHVLPSENARIYLSSANWKPEALENRVETLIEIENLEVKKQLLYEIMVPNLLDQEQSWELQSNGLYKRIKPELLGEIFNCQKFFMGSYF